MPVEQEALVCCSPFIGFSSPSAATHIPHNIVLFTKHPSERDDKNRRAIMSQRFPPQLNLQKLGSVGRRAISWVTCESDREGKIRKQKQLLSTIEHYFIFHETKKKKRQKIVSEFFSYSSEFFFSFQRRLLTWPRGCEGLRT